MKHSQKERHSFLIRKIEGSNPSVSKQKILHFVSKVWLFTQKNLVASKLNLIVKIVRNSHLIFLNFLSRFIL